MPCPIDTAALRAALVLATLLGGCTLMQPAPPGAPATPPAAAPQVPAASAPVPASAPAAAQPTATSSDEALQRLLGIYERSRGLPAAELAREQARLATASGPEATLARLLLTRVAEQRRLEEQLERQAQQQRDLQRRNDQLREQLDALRAIERSLGPRPAVPAPR